MPVEERGLSSRLILNVAKYWRLGNPINSDNVRELQKVLHAEVKKELEIYREATDHPGGGSGGCRYNTRLLYTGGNTALSG